MGSMKYHRPQTVKETLALMDKGTLLGGGTALTPQRFDVEAIIDLQDLNLDELKIEKSKVHVGATVRLQALIKAQDSLPQALVQACRQEAALNIRNAATVAGMVMTADGRSPLLTALLALDASVNTEPGNKTQTLQDFLEDRKGKGKSRLIVALELKPPDQMLYTQVSRSPADRPLVCLAVASSQTSKGKRTVAAVLGGYGERPVRLTKMEDALAEGMNPTEAAAIAEEAYSNAGDAFASAAYRAEIAAVLTRRLLTEVMG